MANPFHDIFKGVQNYFHSGVHDIVAGLTALAHSIQVNGGTVLLTAAASGVAAAEAQGGTGKDKFNAAQEAVIAALTSAGIPLVMNAINGAIESAVAQHKANLESAS